MTEETSNVSISEWIANAIVDTGCRVVFGGHGGALASLVNAVVKHPDLLWVYARNEHDAATMAAAYSKLTGNLGVVIATSGPGATNLTTGLMEALLDGCPLLAITGMKPTAAIGYSEFQDVDQSRLFAGAGIKWSKDATSVYSVIPLLRDAVATAVSFRTCAHLGLPIDIQAAPSPLEIRHFCASHANMGLTSPSADASMITGAAAMLVGHETEPPPRNVIAVGRNACYGHDMSEAILDLAEALNAPVLTRLDAKGVVDEQHPLAFGVIGVHGKPGMERAASLISTSDCILSIGVPDETLLLCNAAGLQIRKLIEVQPDALAVGTRFHADYTLLGNLERVVRDLTSQVEVIFLRVNKKRAIVEASTTRASHMRRVSLAEQLGYMSYHNPKAARHLSIADGIINSATHGNASTVDGTSSVKEDMEMSSDALWISMAAGKWKKLAKHDPFKPYTHHKDRPGYCHPSNVMIAYSKLRASDKTDEVSKDAVVAVDVGDVTLWASLCLVLKGGSRTLYSERLGSMGYALNAGIAGLLAKPAPAAAVVFAGDGGFQMTLNELSTFQQVKRPGDKLLCVVFDNQVLGRVAFGFDNALGCECIGPDYVALAKAYGGYGALLNNSHEVMNVLKIALVAEGLFILHVIVDPEVKADMATFRDKSVHIMNSG